jgi:hypothetical protein
MKIKSLFSTKKRIAAVALSGAVILGSAGIAAAYFTATGTGTGSATVGAATSWSVVQTGPAIAAGTSTLVALYPDAASGLATGPPFVAGMNAAGTFVEGITYTVTNTSPTSQYLHSVQISVANGDGSAWSYQPNGALPACTAADFSIVDENTLVNQPNGTTFADTMYAGSFSAGASGSDIFGVELIDNGLNQDNCEGVTVPLYFVAS